MADDRTTRSHTRADCYDVDPIQQNYTQLKSAEPVFL